MTAGPHSPPEDAIGPVPGRDPRRPFVGSPFSRLARTHALGIAGDAMFAIALAGSVFFSLDFDEARWKVALYLLLTIAPFAVAAPLIGPALDRIRGGRRWVVVASMALRALLCFFVIRHLDTIWFYPEAFLMLVLGKTYSISKSAIVPTTVRNDTELVEANSKLTVISAVAAVAAALPAGLLLKLGGPRWALGLGVIVFVVATVAALRLPQTTVASEPADEVERMELRSAAILLASTAMGMIRGVVGFLAFMLAFAFKNADAPLWQLGLVAATAQIGFFVGALTAPWLRRHADEERILVGSLAIIGAAGLVCAGLGGLAGAALLSLAVGATSSVAKQSFDAIVQRDAPDANRGRSFARFETRFQLYWVIGALVPIVIPVPAVVGFFMIAAVAGFSAGNYALGMRRMRQGRITPRRSGIRVPRPGFVRRRTDPGATPAADAGAAPPAAPTPPDDQPPSGPATGEPTDSAERSERTDATLLGGDDAPTMVAATPAATPAASGGRPWRRESAEPWVPPPGFVSQPLRDGAEQPPLPLDEPGPYPEPRWRNDEG